MLPQMPGRAEPGVLKRRQSTLFLIQKASKEIHPALPGVKRGSFPSGHSKNHTSTVNSNHFLPMERIFFQAAKNSYCFTRTFQHDIS
jgi:hypothetical protein